MPYYSTHTGAQVDSAVDKIYGLIDGSLTETEKKAIGANIDLSDNAELTAELTRLAKTYAFGGVATPSTNPGTLEVNMFYLATEAGTYVNMGGVVVSYGQLMAIVWADGQWESQVVSDSRNYELFNILYQDLSVGAAKLVDDTITIDTNITWFRHKIIPCYKGQVFDLYTVAKSPTSVTYCFVDADLKLIEKGSQISFNGYIEAPKGSAFLVVNLNNSELADKSLFHLRSVIYGEQMVEKAASEQTQGVVYTSSDLSIGNLVATPVGGKTSIGGLTTYSYGIFPATKGDEFIITSTSVGTARGICFVDEDGIILATADAVGLSNAHFIAPERTSRVCVNCANTELNSFKLERIGVRSAIDKNTKDISEIKAMLAPAESSIPMFYGKDMFFVKDKSLPIFAKSVLLKNYPKYAGIYINDAPVLAAGGSYDFAHHAIQGVRDVAEVYFENGRSVDIFANNGDTFTDQWSVVQGINVHTTDLSTKDKNVKVMCIGSSTTQIGLATYLKEYLATLGVTMVGCGSKVDYLGTKSEGYYGWSCAQLCGRAQNADSYPQTGESAENPFMKLATAEDKVLYPNRCYTCVEGSRGTRESYADAENKDQDFYIFDFAWYLQTRNVETPDVIFFMLGLNDSVSSYEAYMPWIVDRIIQACPNARIGINAAQALRFESAADSKLDEVAEKFNTLYSYVNSKEYDKMKVVSVHAHNSPDFSHDLTFSDGDNAVTSLAVPNAGFLHQVNNGYIECAKSIGAFVAYCLNSEG